MAETTYRLRVGHSKVGRLRHLSHLELTRACERAVRRAGLPYAVSRGFNPKLRMAFGPALPVGTAGEREYYDVWLTTFVDTVSALVRLESASTQGLAPFGARYVREAEPSLSAALTIADYVVRVQTALGPSELQDAMEAVRESGELVVERKGRTKVFDLALALPKEPAASSRKDGIAVEMTVRLGPAGALRPESFILAALDHAGVGAQRVDVTRTHLFAEEGSDWRPPLE